MEQSIKNLWDLSKRYSALYKSDLVKIGTKILRPSDFKIDLETHNQIDHYTHMDTREYTYNIRE